MTWGNILSDFYYNTRTVEAQHDLTALLRIANEYQKQLTLKILKVMVDRNATIKESYADAVAYTGVVEGQVGYMGEYPFPTEMLKMDTINVTYDGTNIYTCRPYDIKENLCIEHDVTDIQNKFSENDPRVRFERDSFFIRPLFKTTRTAGIHLWHEARQIDLATTASIPSIIEDFHELFSLKLAKRWGSRNPEKNNPQWGIDLALLENEMQEFFKNRFKRKLQMRNKWNNYK